MADTEYKPQTPPLVENDRETKRFITTELMKIAEAIKAINERLKAGGL